MSRLQVINYSSNLVYSGINSVGFIPVHRIVFEEIEVIFNSTARCSSYYLPFHLTVPVSHMTRQISFVARSRVCKL